MHPAVMTLALVAATAVQVATARHDAGPRPGIDASAPARAASTRQDAARSPEFVPLFKGSLDGWSVQNTRDGNFSVNDGVLRVQGPGGWLRYDGGQFTDMELRTEFRFVTADADSGVFLRAVGDRIFMRGWPGDSYQVQVRVPTTPSPLPPVAGLFRHGTPPGETTLDTAAVLKAFTGLNAWQRLEIDVAGDTLVVRLNGIETTRASGLTRRSGWIGIQGETGTIEYRSVEIRER